VTLSHLILLARPHKVAVFTCSTFFSWYQ